MWLGKCISDYRRRLSFNLASSDEGAGVGPSAWYTLAEQRWYSLAAHPWYSLADYRWYTVGRHLTLQAYQQAIGLDPRSPWGPNGVGAVHEALGRYDEALAAYQQALALCTNDRDRATVTRNLGDVHLALGRYEEALQAYQQAIKMAQETISSGRIDIAFYLLLSRLWLSGISRDRAHLCGSLPLPVVELRFPPPASSGEQTFATGNPKDPLSRTLKVS